EGAQARERIGLGVRGRAQIRERLADALFEEREQQLVLAVEMLVETAERLLRAIDDLLDREVARAPFVDQCERRIQQALDALFGARARRCQALGDRSVTPARFISTLQLIHACHGKLRSLST